MVRIVDTMFSRLLNNLNPIEESEPVEKSQVTQLSEMYSYDYRRQKQRKLRKPSKDNHKVDEDEQFP